MVTRDPTQSTELTRQPPRLMMAQPILTMRGIARNYGDVTALGGVDVTVYPGEVLGIVGESGSGKSTLLRMMNLEDTPDTGTYNLALPGQEGRNLFTLDRFERRMLRAHHIGIVYQNPHLGLLMNHTSSGNVADLGVFFAARGLRLNVMIEYGVVGGRCGCRSEAEVLALAEAIKAQPGLALTGIEGYEGVIHGDQAVSGIREFAASLVRLAVQLQDSGAFAIDKPIITASGSAWYDLIAESFEAQNAAGRFLSVLRPGSYVAHDHGIYKEAQCCVLDRRSDLHEGLRPALEVWAHVQSLPEPGFAVIALGKRDVAYDAGLPVPLLRYRAGVLPAVGDDVSACTVTAVMDQHAFMTVAPGVQLRVGDIISFGTSHPCLTFDKWRTGCLVDEQLNVIESMETCF